MNALVVGQAPSRDTDGQPPFSGRSGKRLAALLGVDHAVLRRHVDVVNLLDRWPGKSGKGDRFPIGEARAAAAMLLAVAPHERIVACGAQVARALGARSEPLAVSAVRGRVVLAVPHPSGVNRWWNDPENVERATRSLRRFVVLSVRLAG